MLFRTFVIALVLVGTAVYGRSVPQKELFGETPIVNEIILPSRIQIELPAPEAPKLPDEAKNQKIKLDPIVLVEPPEAIAQLIDPVDARPVNPIFLDKKTKPNPVLTEEPEPKVQLIDPLAPRPVHPIYLDKKSKPAPIVLIEEKQPPVQLIDPVDDRRQPGEGLGEWFKRTGIQVEPIPELPIPEPVAEPRKQ